MIFNLPLPPSTNRMYRRAGNIIHKSGEYRAWLTQAGWQFASQVKGHSTIKSAASVEVFVGKMHGARDLDSIIKPLGDFLQEAQIVANDKLIRSWHVAADCDSVPKNTVMIVVKEMGKVA